jgi:hypothetical protein
MGRNSATHLLTRASAGAGTCLDPAPFTISGTLRSLVVDNGAGLEYYYQVTNTSPGPVGAGHDIFRLAIEGFTEGSVTYRTDGLAGIVGAGAYVTGTKGFFSADQDPSIPGELAFDFDSTQTFNLDPGGTSTAPDNLEPGESSYFLVIRPFAVACDLGESGVAAFASDGPSFPTVKVTISGGDTALATAFGPVPEPATGLLFGSGLLTLGLARRRPRQDPTSKILDAP